MASTQDTKAINVQQLNSIVVTPQQPELLQHLDSQAEGVDTQSPAANKPITLPCHDLPKDFNFPIGTKFLLSGQLWHVRKAKLDSGIEWRTVYSDGNETNFMLKTLLKDAKDITFTLIDFPRRQNED